MAEPPFGVSPFRTPAALAKTRHLRVKAVLRSARGAQFCGVDAKVWLFAVAHSGAVLTLYGCQTTLTRMLDAAMRLESAASVAYMLTLAAALAATVGLYSCVYASDPGWVTSDVAASESGSPGGEALPPCQYCGVRPPLRSRHCLSTGQCVRKFDHFCHLLSTAIGDLNHAKFYLFIACELMLCVWGAATVGQWAARCAALRTRPAVWQQCWAGPQPLLLLPLGVALVAVAALFAYLACLHLYLMVTGQTTYEVVKGPRVPYLAAAHAQREAGSGKPAVRYALPYAFPRLLADTCLRGRGPPAPFALPGAARNLRRFWLAPKPAVYRQAPHMPGFTVLFGPMGGAAPLSEADAALAQADDVQRSQLDV
eukprot:jgi/Tetstr1/428948/TSEL_018923.t1